MAHSVVIRDVRPEDVEAIVDIALAAWEPINVYRRKVMEDELFAAAVPDWQGRKARDIRSACAPGSGATVCVAEDGGQIVGFVTFYVHDASRIGEIGNNAVHPAFRGKGIATAMYQHAFERLRERGMRFVRAATGGDQAHAPARRAYERAGFSLRMPYVHYYCKL
jgi:ribosomal protein S18 acetylase RimI-like enzyme